MPTLQFVLLCLLCSAPGAAAAPAEGDDLDLDFSAGGCEDLSDDCVAGYTSLLQESVHLATGHRLEAPARAKTRRTGKGPGEAASTPAPQSEGSASKRKSSRGLMIEIVVVVLAVALLAAVFYWYCLRPAIEITNRQIARHHGSQRSSVLLNLSVNVEETEDVENRIHDYMDQDTYSLAIALLVRDMHSLTKERGELALRYSRMVFAVCLVFATCAMQIMIVLCTKQFVTPVQVADIRDTYDQYEEAMYNGHTRVLEQTGKQRGVPGFFNESAFDDLDDDLRENACNIPFSQFGFFAVILFVWSITCFAAIKKSIELFMTLIVFSKNVVDMKESVVDWQKAADDDSSAVSDGEPDKVSQFPASPAKSQTSQATSSARSTVQVIVGLTQKMKVFLTLTVFLPEIGTNLYLLWLGSRWLAATTDWGDIVCNAVALEFILRLKELLFYAVASDRNRRDLGHTGIAPPWPREPAGFVVFFNPMCWAVLSALWAYAYVMYFQKVLPSYQWDVSRVCNSWLAHILDASGGD